MSFPWFGWFLVGEARRLELDAPCVASLAAYAAAHVVYLAASVATHLREASYGAACARLPDRRLRRAFGGANDRDGGDDAAFGGPYRRRLPRPPPRSALDRAGPALVLVATHAPRAGKG